MLLLTAFVECSTADRERVIESAGICATATRLEDGCLEYRFYEDTEEQGRFVFVERWSARSALDSHFASPHLAEFQQSCAPLLTSRRVVLYEVEGGTEL
jgi:quinol monooxygenase YgiN